MSRLKLNLEIIEYLKGILTKYPELRFTQLLWILEEGKDHFFEEPEDTLKRYKNLLS